jgi:hypothetical protein
MAHTHDTWQRAEGHELDDAFLMTVIGASDHWLFVSSTGALTAGRESAQHALFSYETEDRLHRAAGQVGPYTVIRARRGDAVTSWRPFDPRVPPAGAGVTRRLAKRTLGDELTFSEHHHALGLTFSYTWSLSEAHGFVRRCVLTLDPDAPTTQISLADGLLAILPHRVDASVQQTASVLVDAYKHAELLSPGVGLYALSSRIIDRAEPAESLTCSVAYSWGLPEGSTVTLTRDGLDAFLGSGEVPRAETLRLGKTADYLVYMSSELAPGAELRWAIGADTAWEAHRVVALQDALARPGFDDAVSSQITANRAALCEYVARADGFERSGSPVSNERHAANVLFNCMRGGLPPLDGVPTDDLVDTLRVRRASLAQTHGDALLALGEVASRRDVLALARDSGDPDLVRLCSEYMPLTFSRRHGDPSRPWNTFNIKVREPDGARRLYYEGNWRDVFQNWEALLLSFPQLVEAAVTVFVNASTPDGHNPYRITRDGIDWERPDPEDPWANIGYWGDHQIIYLLKLLELYEDHYPGQLSARLSQHLYVYADVPYRLRPLPDLFADPHDTIDFDKDADRATDDLVARIGADGRLVHGPDGQPVRATLAEKLLVPVLAKLSHLVLDAGIWMNTQRPEWNDANNALVGNGVSAVTLAYLVRHVAFLRDLFAQDDAPLSLHTSVADWLERALATLTRHAPDALLGARLERIDEVEAVALVADPDRARTRRALLEDLGASYSDYRARVYAGDWGDPREVTRGTLDALLELTHTYLVETLATNRRPDGLYHAYNLIDTHAGERLPVRRLDLMLEGQVAALSSGALPHGGDADMIDTLYASALYRPDQHTFLLYPARTLPRFLDRHVVPRDAVAANPLLAAIADDPTARVASRDLDGVVRFGGDLKDADALDAALTALAARAPIWRELVDAHRAHALETWERVFSHHSYTGRSSSMYGYEGLGSVYWHMVSKLVLAAQERFWAAADDGVDRDTLAALAARYYRLRAGLGDHKTFSEYGAFPTDAYSHTPPGAGARQPGMTGQVKEDILTRRGELGVRVRHGALHFDPALLRPDEFLSEPSTWRGVSLDRTSLSLELAPGQLAATVCQVPVRVTLADVDAVTVRAATADGLTHDFTDGALPAHLSQRVFARDGFVKRIDVDVPADAMVLDATA